MMVQIRIEITENEKERELGIGGQIRETECLRRQLHRTSIRDVDKEKQEHGDREEER